MRTWIQRSVLASQRELRLAKKDWARTPAWLKWLHYFAIAVTVIACVLIYAEVV